MPCCCFPRSAVARHSCLYVLVMAVLLTYVYFCPAGEGAARDALYDKPPLWLMLLLGGLFFGGAEAVALWLFGRKSMLRPAAQVAGSVLLWVCFPLFFCSLRFWLPSLPDEAQESVLPWLFFYSLVGSHLLWAAGVAVVQCWGGRGRRSA